MEFDSWQQWGRALGDADFARAWTALGIAAGSEVKRPGSEGYVGLLERNPQAATSDTCLEIARSALTDALSACREHGRRLRWSFPTAAATVDADGRFPLTRIDPASWARAWTEVAGAIDVRPRLRVTDAPKQDAVAPWFRLLSETQPGPDAVSLALRAANASLAIEWPVRFGTLPDNEGGPILAVTLAEWPSSRLARRVPIDRDNANCDILLHAGSAASLLRALRAQPFRCKANIVVLLGSIDPDPVALDKRLRAIATKTCASGIVLHSAAADPRVPGYAWNRFVEEMSHNVTIDRALHVALHGLPAGDEVIWLTDALADLKLSALAGRITARVRALPPGSAIDVSRLNAGWVRSTSPILSGGATRTVGAGPAADLARVDSASVEFDAQRLSFDAESHGASELAMLTTAVDEAVAPPDAETRQAARYLQQQAFVKPGRKYVEAQHGFLQGRPALVRVRIGPPESKWQSHSKAFPIEELPPDQQSWRLTLWLTEPTQLAKPLRGTLKLPRDGPSTECDFRFKPAVAGRFEGRLTVLHRGRVLQTAVLRADVTAADATPEGNAAPALGEVTPVRHRLGDLDRRRQFDLAFVTNHTVAGEPRGVALAADRAWVANVSESLEAVKDINTALSRVTKSVADYADGLDGVAGRALLVDLAQQGALLHIHLVRNQIQSRHNRPDVAEKEYIQIVSTRTDRTVPFEFIYEYAVPEDDAALCPRWREGVGSGKCSSQCNPADRKSVCPMGFWGLRKVIERHQFSPEHSSLGKDVFLQSEPGRDTTDLSLGGMALLASSTRVTSVALATVKDALEAKLGTAPRTASSWAEWATIVGQANPHFLLAMPHADGTGAKVTLEISGDTLKTILLEDSHLRPDANASHPLVALLGCDVAGTASDYGEHIVVFREHGAAIVIGTIAAVFGEHAARTAVLLADVLIPNGGPPQRVGEAIRALKRRALLDGLLMPLCIVAYGDADWRLTR